MGNRTATVVVARLRATWVPIVRLATKMQQAIRDFPGHGAVGRERGATSRSRAETHMTFIEKNILDTDELIPAIILDCIVSNVQKPGAADNQCRIVGACVRPREVDSILNVLDPRVLDNKYSTMNVWESNTTEVES